MCASKWNAEPVRGDTLSSDPVRLVASATTPTLTRAMLQAWTFERPSRMAALLTIMRLVGAEV